jgi:hypothetical protein
MIAAIETPVGAIVTNVHLMEMIKAAGAAGEQLPSSANITLLNTLFNALQSAITGGAAFRDVYARILIYANDRVYSGGNDLGFDGRHGNDPYKKAVKDNGGTLTKTVKEGYQTDGVSCILQNYIPANETITSTTDVGILTAWRGVVNSTSNHGSGGIGLAQKTGNTNIGHDVYSSLNVATVKSGNLIFYSERVGSELVLYVNNVAESYQNPLGPSGSKSPYSTRSLTRTNALGNPDLGWFLNSATKEAISIAVKRSNINRTTLHNAVNNYLNGVAAL